MTAAPRPLPTLLLLLALCASASAQTPRPTDAQSGARITVSLTARGARFAALGAVTHTRLEVFGPAGEQVYVSGFLPGNLRDWPALDAQGRPLPDGAYTCVVTAREAGGRVSTREGALMVAGGQLSLQLGGVGAVSDAAQQPAEPPVEAEGGAMTVVAHDGSEGQVTSTAGALTLRTGDFFAGGDVERVRVTEDGRVGVGTPKPKAKLDVAGAVRASGGFIFSDGTSLTSEGGKLAHTDAAGASLPVLSIAGTGTLNRIAKWTDNAGNLGDSAITETAGGNVGIGTASPASALHLAGAGGVNAITLNTPGSQRLRLQTIPKVQNWGALTLNSNFSGAGWLLDEPTSNGWFFKLDTRPGNFGGYPLNGLWLYQVPAGAGQHTDERPVFGVSDSLAFFSGNVGVGTNSPTARLHVAGNGLFTGNLTVNGTLNATLPAGSFNYVQVNPPFPQSGAGFNLGGGGTLGGTLVSAGLNVDSNTLFVDYTNDRVGVGTGSPAAKLHVTGEVNFTGFRTETTATSPNVIGGYSGNTVTAGVSAATIGGGGANAGLNRVTDIYGTVGGGENNQAGDGAGATDNRPSATVGGGGSNIAGGGWSTVGGGIFNNADGLNSTVGGGGHNTANGQNSTVSGGGSNLADGLYSTVGGGASNNAAGDYSFAAGRRAKAVNQGAFVWADSTNADFASTANNQFLVRAAGGVGINTNSTGANSLSVTGNSLFTGNMTVTGTLNAALPAGSANYIQNQTAAAQSGGFNVSGDGTLGGTLSAGILNAASFYSIGGNIVLKASGTNVIYGGANAGQSNAGNSNAFFGVNAGRGSVSVLSNGSFNSFFGYRAGEADTTGGGNIFVGNSAGLKNTSGSENTFVGSEAGRENLTGGQNSFVGKYAGLNNTASNNVAVGYGAGKNNTGGAANIFVGNNAGLSNTTENNNTFVGASANGAAGITNATAIGAGAIVTQSNTVVLGTDADAAVTGAGRGLILRAFDGANCWRVKVNNAGTLSTQAVICP